MGRNAKGSQYGDNDDDNDDDADQDDHPKSLPTSPAPTTIPSFRSDRRILRLLIARHFADVLQRAYLKERDETSSGIDSKTLTDGMDGKSGS